MSVVFKAILLGAMTLSITTFRIMTFSITTLSIMGLFAALSITEIQHINTTSMLNVAFYLLFC